MDSDKETHAFRASMEGITRADGSREYPWCYYCGGTEDEHEEQPLELHSLWPEPVSS